MEVRYFVVDAFTSRPFAGNPAAVVPLDAWLPDATMQSIAAEMNLSETAFIVGDHIRWMTPQVEVDLCGHATLASAHVLLRELEPGRERVEFRSKSGPLAVRRDGDRLVLDFPARPPRPCEDRALSAGVGEALGAPPREVLMSRDLVAIYDDADTVRALAPDMAQLARLPVHGVIVTAPGGGDGLDFVSRFFVPQQGIPEDPVTGSAHCTLIPLWAGRLGKPRLSARQVSRRGGDLACELRGDRVDIGGHATLVAHGMLRLP
jgi:PhzF family phenazine biosynthesis protein